MGCNGRRQAGQYTLGGLDAERMGQSQALQDWFGIQSQRDSQRSNYMNEMLTLSERQRAIEQERINQMIQAGYLPLNLKLTAPADIVVGRTQLPKCTGQTVTYGGLEDD